MAKDSLFGLLVVATGVLRIPPEIPSNDRPLWTAFSRPLKNAPFCPISASCSNFNPRNTQCIPVVKIFAFLELEQK
jgi:hypothetical protein